LRIGGQTLLKSFSLDIYLRNISKMTRFWKIQQKSSSGKKSKNLFEKQIEFAGKYTVFLLTRFISL